MTTYVVDLNMLQSVDLANLISTEPQARFVLPDVAFVEMSKHEDWRLTMGLALNVFGGKTECIDMSLSVGEAMNEEFASGKPIATIQLLPDDFRQFLRGLVSELAEKRSGPNVARMDQNFSEIRRELLASDINASGAKQRALALVQVWLDGMKPILIKAIRKPNADKLFFLSLVQVNAEEFCRRLLTASGRSTDEVSALIQCKPMCLRYLYAITRHSLLAVKQGGGIQAMDAAKELNHQLDLDYGIVASYFDGILTKDRRAKEAYDDLMEILNTSSEVAASRVRAGFVELGLIASPDAANTM
ncbi:hypothetical protein LGM42_07445 [Burkholderia sp. AU39826]|uniref:hypothetical protein n=1 Tax=Burkholderia sp. AU39826 TaxID=2879634 RepID=UPI001CF5DB5B|nr:hypothetical protein [Burkholderia sp. AU39826]MCA7969728.1 hypothetical protein [Burkholderia sp. AU39826]